jgi:hypothetical protein
MPKIVSATNALPYLLSVTKEKKLYNIDARMDFRRKRVVQVTIQLIQHR